VFLKIILHFTLQRAWPGGIDQLLSSSAMTLLVGSSGP